MQITEKNVNFTRIRRLYMKDSNIKDSLNYGREILNRQDQLDQYLFSYGLMVSSQWDEMLKDFKLRKNKLDIVDYGCGQGLATIKIFDCLISSDPEELEYNVRKEINCVGNNLSGVSNINLIEP